MSKKSPMDLLKEEMQSNQMSVRINAIHRVSLVATVIGDAGVKNELLPYLDKLVDTEDDEILFSISNQLGSLFPTYTKHFEPMVKTLEKLAVFEETVVRDQSVRSMISIAENLSPEQNAASVIPCVLRLASGNWFTNRVSAIHIMASLYDKAGVH